MAARFILPWFGGGPAVWSTCLLFFQVALLAGYAYAHLTRRLSLVRQTRLHLALLALAMLTLPIAPSAAWAAQETGAPAVRILLLLTATLGAPYIVLAATAPLLQDWFAQERHGRRAVPALCAVEPRVAARAARLSDRRSSRSCRCARNRSDGRGSSSCSPPRAASRRCIWFDAPRTPSPRKKMQRRLRRRSRTPSRHPGATV